MRTSAGFMASLKYWSYTPWFKQLTKLRMVPHITRKRGASRCRYHQGDTRQQVVCECLEVVCREQSRGLRGVVISFQCDHLAKFYIQEHMSR